MQKILKLTGIILGVLIVLVLISGIVLYPKGIKKLSQSYPDISVQPITIPTDRDAPARGRHVAIIWACARCHGDNMGGMIMMHDPIDGYIPTFATIPAPNLTSGKGGIAQSYKDVDWVRAIRHGVKPNGEAEIFMYDYSTMSNSDLGDLIAYIKQLPAVNNDHPEKKYGSIFPIVLALGYFIPAAQFINHTADPVSEPVPGPTKEYGKYLSVICTSCHGSLVAPIKAKWKEEEFKSILSTGVLPGGRKLGPAMSASVYGQLSDTELKALWLYFRN